MSSRNFMATVSTSLSSIGVLALIIAVASCSRGERRPDPLLDKSGEGSSEVSQKVDSGDGSEGNTGSSIDGTDDDSGADSDPADGEDSVGSPSPTTDPEPGSNATYTVSGSFFDRQQQRVQLESFNQRPFILMLATDMCLTCQDEAQKLDSLQESLMQQGVDFITVLMHADKAILEDWLGYLEITPNWQVGYEDGKKLFGQFFGADSELSTPAIVAFNPATNKTIKHIGSIELEQLIQQIKSQP